MCCHVHQTVPSFCVLRLAFRWLTRSTSATFRCGHRPSPSGYGFPLPFGGWHSLLGPSCSRWGVGPPLRLADCRRRPQAPVQTPSGFPRSTPLRCSRVGCLLCPGVLVSPMSAPIVGMFRSAIATVSLPVTLSIAFVQPTSDGSNITRLLLEFHFRSPVRLSLCLCGSFGSFRLGRYRALSTISSRWSQSAVRDRLWTLAGSGVLPHRSLSESVFVSHVALVLDAPVATSHGEEVFRSGPTGRQAGNGVADFGRGFPGPLADAPPLQATELLDMRPWFADRSGVADAGILGRIGQRPEDAPLIAPVLGFGGRVHDDGEGRSPLLPLALLPSRQGRRFGRTRREGQQRGKNSGGNSGIRDARRGVRSGGGSAGQPPVVT